jgi:flap endonuclease-1
MGIKSLMKLIDKKAAGSVTNAKITDYRNKVLGIDANLMIYKMVYAIRRNGYDIKKGGIVTTHIHATLNKLLAFRKYKIQPVFVFDTKMPEIKKHTMDKRKDIQKQMKAKYENSVTVDDKKKYYYHKSDITIKEIDDVRQLIKIFGYQIVDAKEEADTELAALSRCGSIDGVISDDTDMLTFGAKILIKNFTVSDKKVMQEINLEKMLHNLNISMDQFIELCVLIGCDYCSKTGGTVIKGSGPMKSYDLIKKYKSIRNLEENKIIVDKQLLQTAYKAANYFRNPVHNSVKIKMTKQFNALKFAKFLEQRGYNLLEINDILKKV